VLEINTVTNVGQVNTFVDTEMMPCATIFCQTNTPAGLNEMSAMFGEYTTTNQKVGIVLTDGLHNFGNLNAAIAGVPDDVYVFGIGVNRVGMSELLSIADSGEGEGDGNASSRVFFVTDFGQLNSITNMVLSAVCSI